MNRFIMKADVTSSANALTISTGHARKQDIYNHNDVSNHQKDETEKGRTDANAGLGMTLR